MPIEVGIWRIDKELERINFSLLESEKKLEDILNKDLSLLSPSLMLIGRQVPTAHGKFIDLLAMNGDGNLIVIELKRDKTPREVVAQLLDYASWVQTLSYDEITDIYAEQNGGEVFEKGFEEVFDCNPPDKLNEQLQLIVVAAELDLASERIINYLSDNFGVPINAIFFRYFKDGKSEYLSRTWLIDPKEAEVNVSKSPSTKGRETWNGQDFYVSYGDDLDGNLDWEDAKEHGFISADGGVWYTRTMKQLFVGARVFACIPGTGYVGAGEVTETVKSINDFTLRIENKDVPFLKVPLNGSYMREKADNPKECAYFVRLKWIKTLSRDQAYWEKGMYANQNTVTKLRNRFTLERLHRYFAIQNE